MNLETDIIGKYVEKMTGADYGQAERERSAPIADFAREERDLPLRRHDARAVGVEEKAPAPSLGQKGPFPCVL